MAYFSKYGITDWYSKRSGPVNTEPDVKNYCKPVSRILSYPPMLSQRRTELSFICPKSYPKGSICLPTVIERAVLRQRHTWHFSTQGLPRYYITVTTRRLLPYVFTFSPPKQSSYFLWHFLLPRLMRDTRLFTGTLLYAVRTFLPDRIVVAIA